MSESRANVRTVDVVITGRVQGVGYRFWTREQAERHGIAGHVRNREDGAVEATFSGCPEAVTAVIEACRRGPRGACVLDVVVAEHEGPRPAGEFGILPG